MAEKADTMSQYQSINDTSVSGQFGGLVHRVKMSGIKKQHQIGILPPSVNSKYRQRNPASISSKHSRRSRTTVKNINGVIEQP